MSGVRPLLAPPAPPSRNADLPCRTGLGQLAGKPGFFDQVRGNEAIHNAEYLPMTCGRLANRKRAPKLRRFANRFADFWISWASGQRVPDSQSGFRIYPAALLREVHPPTSRHRGFVFESQMLIDGARAGFPCIAVPVHSTYTPGARQSYFRPGRDVWWIFWMVWWKIWLRALYLPGLWRALTRPTR